MQNSSFTQRTCDLMPASIMHWLWAWKARWNQSKSMIWVSQLEEKAAGKWLIIDMKLPNQQLLYNLHLFQIKTLIITSILQMLHGNFNFSLQTSYPELHKPVLCYKESEQHFPLTEMIIDFSWHLSLFRPDESASEFFPTGFQRAHDGFIWKDKCLTL